MATLAASARPLQEHTSPLGPVIGYSLLFHVIAFLIVPLAAQLMARQKKFERPRTFQMVSLPSVSRSVSRPVAKPAEPISQAQPVQKKQGTTPVPAEKKKPLPAKPEPQQEVSEDVSELAQLLGAMATPTQVTSLTSDFEYPWYLRTVESKIRSFWRPPYENENISVTVQFEITQGGEVAGLKISSGSGDPALDNLAIRAVTLAAPFGKLPPRFAGGSFQVSCKLVPTRK